MSNEKLITKVRGIELKIAVVGGGFYGLWIAQEITKRGINVTLYEKNEDLLQEASLLNQARVHNGYHYPRSISTFASSQKNYLTFLNEFAECIEENITSLYLLSVKSKVSKIKFEKICNTLQAPLHEVPRELSKYIDSSLIEKAWKVEEKFYNANKIKELSLFKLDIEINVRKTIQEHVLEVRLKQYILSLAAINSVPR